MSLLNGCKQFVPDDNEMHALFQAERSVNVDEAATLEAVAAAYVNLFNLKFLFLTFPILI